MALQWFLVGLMVFGVSYEYHPVSVLGVLWGVMEMEVLNSLRWRCGLLYIWRNKKNSTNMNTSDLQRDRVLKALVGKGHDIIKAAEYLGITPFEIRNTIARVGVQRCSCCGVWDYEHKFVLDGKRSSVCSLCYSSTAMVGDEADVLSRTVSDCVLSEPTRIDSRSKVEVACDEFMENINRIKNRIDDAEREADVKYVNKVVDSLEGDISKLNRNILALWFFTFFLCAVCMLLLAQVSSN